MAASSSQPIPTALAVPIIGAYAQGIRPAFAFILVATVFGSLLFPLLILLFALSTPQTRRKPIFILNVLSVCLGIIVAAMTAHLSIGSILWPFTKDNVTENFVYLFLEQWTPWFTEAVLLVRIAVVFSRQRLPLLLALPFALKVARAAVIITFTVRWGKLVLGGFSNQFDVLKAFPRTLFKVQYLLELFDNSYVSFLFLWRLGMSSQSRFIEGTAVGEGNLSNSTQTFASKLQTLFWIAATNFVFPLIFGLIQIVTACAGTDIILSVAVGMVNTYVAIISTVFATVWSSTSSLKEAIAQNNRVVPQPLVFRTGPMMDTTLSIPPGRSIQDSGTEKESN
ncbi:hypothetical protein FB451DRAFT_448267 [Mycena latifolia]|nr:hypothetical protein FB451DRAFT_448267 [Mycena latifolia]